jgi:hypothetical protein
MAKLGCSIVLGTKAIIFLMIPTDFITLLQTKWICSFQENFSSTRTPRCLMDETWSISFPPIEILAVLTPLLILTTYLSSSANSTIQVFNCYIVITSPPRPIYGLTSLILPHLHTLYIDFSTVLLTVCFFIPCVTLCCCMCQTALRYLGQGAVANENLLSTSLPG